MRRLLRILLTTLKWTGLSLSTLLLIGTVVLWVRSLGYQEGWTFHRFEPNPGWNTGVLAGRGKYRRCYFATGEQRAWLGFETEEPHWKIESGTHYERTTAPLRRKRSNFDAYFDPKQRQQYNDVLKVGQFADLGFLYIRDVAAQETGRPRRESLTLALPFWMLAVVFGLWPLSFVTVRLLRKKRRAPNQCRHCGYDLRSTPDPAGPLLPRCPECGRHNPEREPS